MGLSNGEVALYKLWNVKGGEPVRMISLADWGFEPETTGSVAELQWSPDNTAIAVLTLLFLACLLPQILPVIRACTPAKSDRLCTSFTARCRIKCAW